MTAPGFRSLWLLKAEADGLIAFYATQTSEAIYLYLFTSENNATAFAQDAALPRFAPVEIKTSDAYVACLEQALRNGCQRLVIDQKHDLPMVAWLSIEQTIQDVREQRMPHA